MDQDRVFIVLWMIICGPASFASYLRAAGENWNSSSMWDYDSVQEMTTNSADVPDNNIETGDLLTLRVTGQHHRDTGEAASRGYGTTSLYNNNGITMLHSLILSVLMRDERSMAPDFSGSLPEAMTTGEASPTILIPQDFISSSMDTHQGDDTSERGTEVQLMQESSTPSSVTETGDVSLDS